MRNSADSEPSSAYMHITFYNRPGAGTHINLIPFQIVFHNPFSYKCCCTLLASR